jgi:hypothetical protein
MVTARSHSLHTARSKAETQPRPLCSKVSDIERWVATKKACAGYARASQSHQCRCSGKPTDARPITSQPTSHQSRQRNWDGELRHTHSCLRELSRADLWLSNACRRIITISLLKRSPFCSKATINPTLFVTLASRLTSTSHTLPLSHAKEGA